MSKQDRLIWHISVSPLNKYLYIDLLKAIGTALVFILLVQLMPIGSTVTTLILAGVIFWGLTLVVKLYTSFTGHSIRYVLDDAGVYADTDKDKIGFDYVSREIADGLKWGTRDVPERIMLPWSELTDYDVDEENHLIILNNDANCLRLFCRENNFQTVQAYVQGKLGSPLEEVTI